MLSASDVADEECSDLIFYKQLAPNMLLRLGARRSEIVYKYKLLEAEQELTVLCVRVQKIFLSRVK